MLLSKTNVHDLVHELAKEKTGTYKKETWGVLLTDLEKHHKKTIDKNLVKELNYIRKHIRNPLVHPEIY